MEQKKQLLIKLLTELKNKRDLAGLILLLIEENKLSEEIIDKITSLISEVMKEISDEKIRKKMQTVKTYMQKLKEQETKEHKQEQENIE